MQNIQREWLTLGDTSVDFGQILKVAFGKDARLFALAGDALVLSAWTSDRKELARLKQKVSEYGWVAVVPETVEEPNYSEPDEPEEGGPSFIEERINLNFVDKVIETKTKNGHVLAMFSSSVFLGEVIGDEIGVVKEYLGT